MDLMINNAYNNTIAEKSQLRETSCMKKKKEFLEEEGIFEHIFYLYKTRHFPVTLIEVCPDCSFIMSLRIAGVSLKKKSELMRFFFFFKLLKCKAYDKE